MTTAEAKELAGRIDEVRAALTRLEQRVAELRPYEAGKIRTDYPHIVRVQGVCGGRPIIEGTRLSVKLIVGWARAGMTPEQIAEQYPTVSLAQVNNALAYYHDHPAEIDAEFAEERRYTELEIPRLQTMIAERHQADK